MTYSTAVIRLQSVIAVLLGVALGAAPMPVLAAAPAAEPADEEVVPEPEDGDAAPAVGVEEGEPPEATDDENPVAAEQASDGEMPTKAEPKPEPKKAPKPKKERKQVDPLWLSGVVVAAAGYASVVISIGLAAGMGVRFERGKDANKAVMSSTRPEDEDRRIDAFANGAKANDSARKLGIAAAVVFGLGIIMIGTGHGLIARANKNKKNRAQLTPTLGPGHAGLSYGMRF